MGSLAVETTSIFVLTAEIECRDMIGKVIPKLVFSLHLGLKLRSFKRGCEIRGMRYCGFNVSAVSEIVAFLLDIASHMINHRGPDVALGPDVVHMRSKQ